MSTFLSDPRNAWAATMLLVAVVLAAFAFVGWRRELREDAEHEAAEAEPHRTVSARIEIKTQPQPKSFSRIPEHLKKRSS